MRGKIKTGPAARRWRYGPLNFDGSADNAAALNHFAATACSNELLQGFDVKTGELFKFFSCAEKSVRH
jgi:hypothetical protein